MSATVVGAAVVSAAHAVAAPVTAAAMSAAPMHLLSGVGERRQRDRTCRKGQRYCAGEENARLHEVSSNC